MATLRSRTVSSRRSPSGPADYSRTTDPDTTEPGGFKGLSVRISAPALFLGDFSELLRCAAAEPGGRCGAAYLPARPRLPLLGGSRPPSAPGTCAVWVCYVTESKQSKCSSWDAVNCPV